MHQQLFGSLVRCQDLISRVLGQTPNESSHLQSTFLALVHNAARPNWHSLEDIDIPLTQKALSRAIDEATFEHLQASVADTRSKALVLSTSIPHAGDWINVIPSQALGLHFLDQEFRGCLQYWLGLPMIEEGHHCPFCQSPADRFGDHQVGCGGNGDRIHRHDSLRDALFSAAQSAALAPRKEMPSLVPGSASRPADVFLPTWERGQPAALDVTVVSTLQNRTVVRAASVSGYALSVARERKVAAHSEACQSVGVSFVPMVVETLGGWDEDGSYNHCHRSLAGSTPGNSTIRLYTTPVPAPCRLSFEGKRQHVGSVALRCILLQFSFVLVFHYPPVLLVNCIYCIVM